MEIDDQKPVSSGSIAFAFKGKEKKKTTTGINLENNEDTHYERKKPEKKEFVFGMEENKIHSSIEEEGPLVIPLISDENSLMAKILAKQEQKKSQSSDNSQVGGEEGEKQIPNDPSPDDTIEKDLSLRPEAPTLEAYDRVPVSAFGEGLLRGMGWETGKPIGKNSNGLMVPIMYVPNNHRRGFGADTVHFDPKKKNNRPDLVARPDASGRTRHVVSIDEKLVERESDEIVNGSKVVIIGGRHSGLQGKVKSLGIEYHTVTLNLNGNDVKVPKSELRLERLYKKEKEMEEEHKKIMKEKKAAEDRNREMDRDRDRERDRNGNRNRDRDEERDRDKNRNRDRDEDRNRDREKDRNREKDRDRERDRDRNYDREKNDQKKSNKYDDEMDYETKKRKRDEEDSRSQSKKPRTWLVSSIRVRIVSKSFLKGKYYNIKGIVLDILPLEKGEIGCTVKLEDGKVVEVPQSNLETVIPKAGDKVILVSGSYKSEIGKLIEKQSSSETAVVQLFHDGNVIKAKYDEICEYTGYTEWIKVK